MRICCTVLLAVALLVSSPGQALAPELPEAPSITQKSPQEISRGAPPIEHRVMRVTAYTRNDEGMDGLGITASGEPVQEGVTIAAPEGIPLYSQIYIPALHRTYTVTDRGGAIKGNRLDLYMESRADALEFGVQELEVYILPRYKGGAN